MLVYPKSDYSKLSQLNHPVFIAIEKEFDEFIESSNPASEYEEMYFGDEAIYSKKGAIRQAIEEMMDEADNTGKPVDIKKFDLWGIFQG